MHIRVDDLKGPEIAHLLETHLALAFEQSPPDAVHALDLEALQKPGITFWTAWQDAELLGCGALRQLTPDHSEIKSMHTVEAHRGKGIARALVEHILAVARAEGLTRISLETGRSDAFVAAQNLYASFGFKECPPFGDYTNDPFSICMTLDLGK